MPIRPTAALALPLFLLGGCETSLNPIEQPATNAALIRADGSVAGSVAVYPQTTAVLLRIDAGGLPPGQHGVHIHTVGRCDPPSFESAGAHWNPTNREHGHRDPQGPHLGDLGNFGVGADGRLVASVAVPGASLYPDGTGHALRDSDGAALVIHARPDDEVTDPSGNSGERIACAIL